jgi:hypothetical protein
VEKKVRKTIDQLPSWLEFIEMINLKMKKTRNDQPIIMKKNRLAASKKVWEMNK